MFIKLEAAHGQQRNLVWSSTTTKWRDCWKHWCIRFSTRNSSHLVHIINMPAAHIAQPWPGLCQHPSTRLPQLTGAEGHEAVRATSAVQALPQGIVKPVHNDIWVWTLLLPPMLLSACG